MKTTLSQVLADNTMVAQAKVQMEARWSGLVKSGDYALGTMIGSLYDQVHGGCQGWDCSYEELDAFDWDCSDMTDGQADQWLRIVQDAAQEWLNKTSLKVWGVYMIQHGEDLVDATESDIMEYARKKVMMGDTTDHDITKEMIDWVLMCRMRGLVLNNLREYAHQAWKSGDEDESKEMYGIVEKLDGGNATAADWLDAMDYCQI